MKVSDPVMFGHAVTVFFKPVFEKHAATFKALGVNPTNGLGDVYAKIQSLPADQKAEIEADIKAVYATRPALAMVDSDKGITNLHVAQRHHRRRVDAGRGPRLGQDVGTRRQAPRHQGDDSRPLLRDDLPDDHRGLPEARRARPGDDGQRAERRPDGAEGRGVRLARQDVHRSSGRHDPRRRRVHRRDPARAEGRAGRHLPVLPDQGHCHPRLGQAGRPARQGDRRPGRLLARQEPRPRCAGDREGRDLSARSRHARASRFASCRPSRR